MLVTEEAELDAGRLGDGDGVEANGGRAWRLLGRARQRRERAARLLAPGWNERLEKTNAAAGTLAGDDTANSDASGDKEEAMGRLDPGRGRLEAHTGRRQRSLAQWRRSGAAMAAAS